MHAVVIICRHCDINIHNHPKLRPIKKIWIVNSFPEQNHNEKTYKLSLGFNSMNQVIKSRPSLKSILKVNSSNNFHFFFIEEAIKSYAKNIKKDTFPKNILVLGASHVEAETMIKFPFEKIVLTGIMPADKKTLEILQKDKRVSYEIENMESLSYKSSSFDLVFAKEAVHHVPRPILAIYEMLRVTKKAIIFVEPGETFIGKILTKLNMASKYETNQSGNLNIRDNYVYRWDKQEIIKILNSYYLESGYKVIFSSCWMSNRYNIKVPSLVKIFNIFGWLASFIPYSEGNYLTCTIFRGKDIPK